MTVQTILSRKGRNVVTIEPTATLQAAIAALAEHRIGAVVVLGADRRVIGILSERDIVRAFAEFGANALTKRLAQVMTREVATCGEAESAVSIMERMTSGKFRHISEISWSASSRSATSSNTGCAKWSRSPRHCATISRAHRRPTDALTGRPGVPAAVAVH